MLPFVVRMKLAQILNRGFSRTSVKEGMHETRVGHDQRCDTVQLRSEPTRDQDTLDKAQGCADAVGDC